MCLLVLSAVSCLHQLSCVVSGVTGYSSAQLRVYASVDSASANVRECVAWNVLFSWQRRRNAAHEGRRGPRPLTCGLGGLDNGVSVTSFCLGEWLSVFFGVSLHFSGELLQCVGWVWMTKRRWEEGPSIARCPKRHPGV